MSAKKVILITGAASGMGLALSERYDNAGHLGIALDIKLDNLKKIADKLGDGYVPRQLDVSDYSAWMILVDEVMSLYGQLDMLINNAGIISSGEFDSLSVESWQAMVNINLMGVVYGSKAVYPMMKKQGFGYIVNTASTAGVTPVLFSISYVATKHAIVGFSNALREEARAFGIEVVVVLPGLVDTNIFDAALDAGNKNSRFMADNTPFGKISARRAAQYIDDGIKKGKQQIAFPFVNKIIIILYRWFPSIMTKLIVSNQKHEV